MNKHTPGPWSVINIHADPVVVAHNGQSITGPWTKLTEEDLANARLIAAAPELLEALSKIVHEFCRNGPEHVAKHIKEPNDAIDKATGGQGVIVSGAGASHFEPGYWETKKEGGAS